MFLARLKLDLKPAFCAVHILALSTLFPKTKLFLLPSDPGMPLWSDLYTMPEVWLWSYFILSWLSLLQRGLVHWVGLQCWKRSSDRSSIALKRWKHGMWTKTISYSYRIYFNIKESSLDRFFFSGPISLMQRTHGFHVSSKRIAKENQTNPRTPLTH